MVFIFIFIVYFFKQVEYRNKISQTSSQFSLLVFLSSTFTRGKSETWEYD